MVVFDTFKYLKNYLPRKGIYQFLNDNLNETVDSNEKDWYNASIVF